MSHRNRKLVAVLVCGILSSAGVLGAQSTGESTRGRINTPFGIFQVGIEGGVALSNLIGDDEVDSNIRTGGYGGLSFILQPNKSAFGLQTGAMYVQKGAKFDEDGIEGGLKVDYLEVPVLLRLGVPLSAGFSPTVLVGGSLAWRVRCRVEANVDGVSASADCNDNNLLGEGLGINRFDGGLSGGVELPITVGGRYIFVPSIRYTRGLTNIYNEDGVDIKNSSIQIGLGIRFR